MNATEATKLSTERDNRLNYELKKFVEEGGMTNVVTNVIREAALSGQYQVYFGTIEHAALQKFISYCLLNGIFPNPEGKITSMLPPAAYLGYDQRKYISTSLKKYLLENGYYIRYNEYDDDDGCGAAIVAWGKDADKLKQEVETTNQQRNRKTKGFFGFEEEI